jgi:tetratricopeptide (TPR) repeat protein
MYRRVILAVFVLLVAVSAIYALMDKKKVTTSSDEAYRAYLMGEELGYKLYTKEALQEFEKAIRLDPDFAMAYAMAARLYFGFDRMDEYKQAKEKALSLLDNVKDFEKLQIRLIFAESDNDTDARDKILKELVERFPDKFETRVYVAGRQWMNGEMDKAIEGYLKIVETDPDYALAYNSLGYLYYRTGQYDKSLEYLNKYAEIAAGQANPQDSKGEILLYLGRYDEALEAFKKADSIKQDLYFVIGHLGDTYLQKRMFRDAMGAFMKARELAPNDKARVDFELKMSDVYRRSGRYGEAIASLEETAKRYPDAVSAHVYLSSNYAQQGMVENALVELGIVKGLLARDESYQARVDSLGDWTPWYVLYLEGRIAVARGEYKTAIDLYKEVLTMVERPTPLWINDLLAGAYIDAGMPDTAIAVLTEALKDNPNHPLCLEALARACKAAGHVEAQREALSRLLAVLKDADQDAPVVQSVVAELKQIDRANP